MLISFTVANFRSIKDPQTFSFVASSDRSHSSTHCLQTGNKAVPRLSKAAVIFGANGSGKSNFLCALCVMRDMVLHSNRWLDGELADRYQPFLFPQGEAVPTEFSIDVLIGQTRHQYSFSFNGTRICSERLLVWSTAKAQRWFERCFDESSNMHAWAPFSPHFKSPVGGTRRPDLRRALFLGIAAQDCAQLRPLMDWFAHGIRSLGADEPVERSALIEVVRHAASKRRLLDFLQGGGVRVSDVRISRLPFPRVEFEHESTNRPLGWIRLDDESSGTQRLVGLFAPLSAAIEYGHLLLADEFDNGLHPLVARHLIRAINDSSDRSRGAQIVMTTQTSTLMDMEILRRDEIWLMELNDSHMSILKTITDRASPPRLGEMISTRYLTGHYGAIPQVGVAG